MPSQLESATRTLEKVLIELDAVGMPAAAAHIATALDLLNKKIEQTNGAGIAKSRGLRLVERE